MSVPQIVTGNTVSLAVTLYKNSATFAIGGTAVVQATLVSSNHLVKILPTPISISSATSGSNWSASRVVVVIPANAVYAEYYGDAKLEIKVTESGVSDTWFVDVEIVKGNI